MLTHLSYPEAELRKLKSQVSTFIDFPTIMGSDGLGLCPHFGRCCCLHPGCQGLNDTCIMVSVVLRSGAHYSLGVLLQGYICNS